jgi:hypothetical protein
VYQCKPDFLENNSGIDQNRRTLFEKPNHLFNRTRITNNQLQ